MIVLVVLVVNLAVEVEVVLVVVIVYVGGAVAIVRNVVYLGLILEWKCLACFLCLQYTTGLLYWWWTW